MNIIMLLDFTSDHYSMHIVLTMCFALCSICLVHALVLIPFQRRTSCAWGIINQCSLKNSWIYQQESVECLKALSSLLEKVQIHLKTRVCSIRPTLSSTLFTNYPLFIWGAFSHLITGRAIASNSWRALKTKLESDAVIFHMFSKTRNIPLAKVQQWKTKHVITEY